MDIEVVYHKNINLNIIFLNTDYGREKSPLTGTTYIYQLKKLSQSVAPEL
jgi:hypothetical protein